MRASRLISTCLAAAAVAVLLALPAGFAPAAPAAGVPLPPPAAPTPPGIVAPAAGKTEAAAPAAAKTTDAPTSAAPGQVQPGPSVPPAPPAARELRPAEFSRASTSQPGMRAISLDVNKSQIVRLARPARDVLVANPAVADIVLRSADTAFVIGRRVGETNVFFFDGEGHQIDALDLTVTFDSGAVNAVLRRMIPNEEIAVTTANQSLILSGSVASPQVPDNARQIARQFVADATAIINLINIRDKNQFLLRVRVSDMSLQIVKELGITPGAPAASSFKIGGSTLNLLGTPPNFANAPVSALSGVFPLGGGSTLTAPLHALESDR